MNRFAKHLLGDAVHLLRLTKLITLWLLPQSLLMMSKMLGSI
jgi:hypothetical protein